MVTDIGLCVTKYFCELNRRFSVMIIGFKGRKWSKVVVCDWALRQYDQPRVSYDYRGRTSFDETTHWCLRGIFLHGLVSITLLSSRITLNGYKVIKHASRTC